MTDHLPTLDAWTADMNQLSNLVRHELSVAGLPVVPDDQPLGTAGALVTVDRVDRRGVHVNWCDHFILGSASLEAWSEGKGGDKGGDNPSARLAKTNAIVMRDAMITILTAAGFDAEQDDDEYDPNRLLVTGRRHSSPWWAWYQDQVERQHARLREMWSRQRSTQDGAE